MTDREIPSSVASVQAVARASGFAHSCSDGTGRLLRTLASSLAPGSLMGESGTGYGVGAAWMLSGRGDGRLVTVEQELARAQKAQRVLADEFGERAEVLNDDWTALSVRSPFSLLFCDGGGKVTHPRAVIDLVAPGGWLVLDDFTPSQKWPPLYHDELDTVRWAYLSSPLLTCISVDVSSLESVIIAVRNRAQ